MKKTNKNSLMVVTIIVVIAKLIAFIKEFVLSYYYGVSQVSDAYNVAYSIPVTIIGFIALALNTSYIPQYNKISKNEGEDSALAFSNNISAVIFFVSVVSFILLEVFAEPIVQIFAGGFNEETLTLSVKLTRLMAAIVMLISFNRILSAYVQLKNKYYIVTLCEVLLYGFSILGIILSSTWGVEWLSWGALVGYIFESFCLVIVSIRNGYKFKFSFNFRDPKIKEFFFLVLPVIIGSVASDINKIVDKNIASLYSVGSVSILSYAHKIDEALISIFVTSLISLSYPRISKHVQDNNENGLKKQLTNDFEFLFFLVVPISLGCIFFSKEITKLLFVRGAFTVENAYSVATAFIIYALGIIPTTIRKYYVRIFYSYSDSKTPATNSLIVIAINIILSIVLAHFWGIYGVAAGSTISICIGALLLIIRIRKHLKIEYKPIIVPFIKIVGSSIIMIIASKTLELFVGSLIGDNITTIISILFAVIVYFFCVFAFGMKHLFSYIKK